MSPRCANCGGHVTREYIRVREPEGRETARVCPECPKKIRDGAEVREARSRRTQGEDNDPVLDADAEESTDWGDLA